MRSDEENELAAIQRFVGRDTAIDAWMKEHHGPPENPKQSRLLFDNCRVADSHIRKRLLQVLKELRDQKSEEKRLGKRDAKRWTLTIAFVPAARAGG